MFLLNVSHLFPELPSHHIYNTPPHSTPPLPAQIIQLNFKFLLFIVSSSLLTLVPFLSFPFFSIFLSLLKGDRFRVEHVIINFLSNAVKFSPDGSEIIIQISGRNRSEAREDPRKVPEGLTHRGKKGGGKEKDKEEKEKDMRTLWSRSPSSANEDRKYCTEIGRAHV